MGSPLLSRSRRLRRTRRSRRLRGSRRGGRTRRSRRLRRSRRGGRTRGSRYRLLPTEIRREIAFAERALLEHEPAHRLEGLTALGASVHSRATGSICWSETHRLPSFSVGRLDTSRTACAVAFRVLACAPTRRAVRETAMSRNSSAHAESTTPWKLILYKVKGAARFPSNRRYVFGPGYRTKRLIFLEPQNQLSIMPDKTLITFSSDNAKNGLGTRFS